MQTAYWDATSKSVVNVNPLSMVKLDDFISGSILRKDLKVTPPDVHELACKLEEEFGEEMGDVRRCEYFDDLLERRVNLMEVMDYFKALLEFMVEKCESGDTDKVNRVVTSFIPAELEEEETDLLDIITNLRESKNTPVLVFNRNTHTLMNLSRKLLVSINDAEESLS